MKKISVLLGVTGLVFAGSVSALPQTKYTASCKPLAPTEGKYEEEGSVGSITSQSAFKKITAANEAYADGKHRESIAMLNEMIADSSDKVAIGRAQSLLGVNYQALENYSAARSAFQKAIDSGFLRKQDVIRLRRGIAQLYAVEENYSQAITWMNKYFEEAIKPPASAYASLASFEFQTGDHKGSICPAYIGLKLGYSSKKPLLSMLFGAHVKLKDHSGAEVVAEEMIELFPKDKSVYNNLFAVYSMQGKNADMLALAELARMNGMWRSETNYKQLSALFSNNKIPQLAAERLKEGIDDGVVASTEENWKKVADNYYFAKDRDEAIEAYTKASGFTSSGKYDYSIANIHFERDDFSKAIATYNKAINKGNLRKGDTGYALIQMGQSYFRLGQYDNAISALKRAAGYPKVSKNANAYIAYIGQIKKFEEQAAEYEAEKKAEQENQSE